MRAHRALLVFLVGLLLPLAPPLGASPAGADTGPNGQIVYDEWLCCSFDIWVVNPDGSGLTNLTNTPEIAEFDPVWSPDGDRISFTRDADIWVMNADGSGQVDLTNSQEIEFGADWSPDGTQLAFVREVPGNVISTTFDIFTMNADGSNQVDITNRDEDELEPAWSPDGTSIAFAAVRQGDWEIVKSNTDGTGEVTLTVTTQEDRAPSWSPDGTKLTWMSQFDEPCCGGWMIWAMNADGSGATQLTDSGGDINPEWSPDGTKIVFTRIAGPTQDLWTIDAPSILPPAAARISAAFPTPTRVTSAGNANGSDWGTHAPTGPIVSVRVADVGYRPKQVTVSQGDTVRWAFVGPSDHTVTDATRMRLFDSGVMPAGSTFAFTFTAAGAYPYASALQPSMRGLVTVPLAVSPVSGGVTATFTVRWATAVPPGYVADVQVARPGGPFVKWRTSQTTGSATFVPNAGSGTYTFRAQLRRLSNGRTSGWSPVAMIQVA
jgi:plastocyanin